MVYGKAVYIVMVKTHAQQSKWLRNFPLGHAIQWPIFKMRFTSGSTQVVMPIRWKENDFDLKRKYEIYLRSNDCVPREANRNTSSMQCRFVLTRARKSPPAYPTQVICKLEKPRFWDCEEPPLCHVMLIGSRFSSWDSIKNLNVAWMKKSAISLSDHK